MQDMNPIIQYPLEHLPWEAWNILLRRMRWSGSDGNDPQTFEIYLTTSSNSQSDLDRLKPYHFQIGTLKLSFSHTYQPFTEAGGSEIEVFWRGSPVPNTSPLVSAGNVVVIYEPIDSENYVPGNPLTDGVLGEDDGDPAWKKITLEMLPIWYGTNAQFAQITRQDGIIYMVQS